jgi:hypothetical protein
MNRGWHVLGVMRVRDGRDGVNVKTAWVFE